MRWLAVLAGHVDAAAVGQMQLAECSMTEDEQEGTATSRPQVAIHWGRLLLLLMQIMVQASPSHPPWRCRWR
jgi:hypothetical protein